MPIKMIAQAENFQGNTDSKNAIIKAVQAKAEEFIELGAISVTFRVHRAMGLIKLEKVFGKGEWQARYESVGGLIEFNFYEE